MGARLKAALVGCLVPLLILILWEGLARAGVFSPVLLPAPSAVAIRWWAYLTPAEAYDPALKPWWRWAISGELPADAAGSLRALDGR